jgi:hypothetical protein
MRFESCFINGSRNVGWNSIWTIVLPGCKVNGYQEIIKITLGRIRYADHHPSAVMLVVEQRNSHLTRTEFFFSAHAENDNNEQ